MRRKLRAKLPIPKHLLKPNSHPVNNVHHQLKACQLHQKAAYDRGTNQLSSPVVVVQQHKSPCSYIMATPNGTQLCKNCYHLMPTNESHINLRQMEPVEEEHSPVMSLNTQPSPVHSPIVPLSIGRFLPEDL